MHSAHVTFSVGPYTLRWDRGNGDDYARWRVRATIVDEIDVVDASDRIGVLAVYDVAAGWPFLIVAHGYVPPWTQDELYLGTLLVPETGVLFVGAHECVLAYDLAQHQRLWRDKADTDFLGWHRHDQVVLMSAELELAAWDIHGRKLWSTFVEPPWDFHIADDTVQLTVLDVVCPFPLRNGPSWGTALPWISR